MIKITIPKGFMNCGVGVNNNVFFADTNDSSNWDNIILPLSKPDRGYKWSIHKQEGKEVYLKQIRNGKKLKWWERDLKGYIVHWTKTDPPLVSKRAHEIGLDRIADEVRNMRKNKSNKK